MKIAIVQEEVDPQRGGAETSTVELARHLAALGGDVTVLHRSGEASETAVEGVLYRGLPVGRGPKALRTYRYVQAATRAVRGGAFELVHAITPCLSADVYQPRGGTYRETIARTLARVPDPTWRSIKGAARRFNLRQRFLQRVEEILLTKRTRRAHVAALSEYVRRMVVDEFSFPSDRVRIVFNGVDSAPLTNAAAAAARAARRATIGAGQATPVILFVAHNFALKGLSELLAAFAAADATGQLPGDAQLVVVGRDDAVPYVRRLQKTAIAGRVHVVGPAPAAEWYAAADVLAHPTWYDPCSRVVLEALCAGLPVVTTKWNGAADVMVGGRHGVVISAPDALDELAVGLGVALNEKVRAACAADAERMREDLSMKRHARELLAWYDEIVRGR